MAGTVPHRLHTCFISSNHRRADIDLFDDFTSGAGGDLSTLSFDFDMSANANFTAINGAPASTSTQTISPKDLLNDSAPPSTAFTNLTSPDIGASPFGTDSYQTSPAFMTEGDFNTTSNDNWFSLFPDSANETSVVPDPIQRTISDHSIRTSSNSSSASPALTAAQHRKSLTETPPSARHSSVSVTKPRRRKGPLPSIELDPHDKVAYKRARNTLAARDSRQRKLEHVQTLEIKIAELEEERDKWKNIALSYGHIEN
ncbi:hypothetical protein NA57DRAFT_80333 [Rhizodiscina lignyota]|uniref:BZIP domain-containing protein n=1 Tax=Rhizodiscina lignyota TaxID=1504668 RepID=A0A9P4IA50_9PEZI|nr:hypothetical protein NA57DRAFT_80333 [Rhizodiscina lignyota]